MFSGVLPSRRRRAAYPPSTARSPLASVLGMVWSAGSKVTSAAENAPRVTVS